MLKLPPADFASRPLVTVSQDPMALVRISPKTTGEPYFGRSGGNRFDDPRVPEANRFGTCYLGRSAVVAIAETVLHNEVAVGGGFNVALTDITRRRIVSFTGSTLTLADCTGIALKRMGLDALFSAIGSYDETQAWSVAIHDHPQKVDGFLYMSRHINDDCAVVLFDRAGGKLRVAKYRRLLTHPGSRTALNALNVTAV